MAAAASPILTSSLDSSSRQNACPNEVVVLVCHVSQTGLLQWGVESFVTIGSNHISCSDSHSPGDSCTEMEFQYFNATLVSFQPNPNTPTRGDVTSNLAIILNSNTTGKHIYCSNGFVSQDEAPNKAFNIGGEYDITMTSL